MVESMESMGTSGFGEAAETDHPIGDRLSLIADLKHGSPARLDEARRIDIEKPRSFAMNLSAEDEHRVEIQPELLQRLGIARMHGLQRFLPAGWS
jgi:hypothetical protein